MPASTLPSSIAAIPIDALVRTVREVAASELMPRFRRARVDRKADGSLVTEADLAVQAALARRLPALAPGPLVGEEMTAEEQRCAWDAGAAGLWIVDPVDGTTNFVKGLPCFAVSVAYFVDGRPVAGVVHNPALDETFDALAGGGARRDGAPLALGEMAGAGVALADAVAAIEPKYLPRALARALAEAPPFLSQRNWGAGSLDWCYLAMGRFDVYAHGGQKLWDYAAGALVFAEAGGVFAGFDDDDFWAGAPWTRSIAAAGSAPLLAEWLGWIRPRLGGRA